MESTDNPVVDFTLTLRTRKIKLGGVDHTVQELSGRERDAYLTKGADRFLMDETGKITGVKNFDNHQADLIVAALRDAEGKPVALPLVQLWPSSTQEAVYDIACELSKLGKYKAKAKNDSGANG